MKYIKNTYGKLCYYVTLSLLTLSFLSSCTLDREDYTEITPDQVYKTEKDLKLMVNGLYTQFQAYTWMTTYDLSEMSAGTLRTSWGDSERYFQQWTRTVGMQSLAWTEFSWYKYLSQARNVIRGIENSSVNDEIKSPYLGEAEGMRGWMEVYLYDVFGTVPVASDEVLDDPETFNYIPRLTEDEYETMVVNDLTDAIDRLPEKQTERGRMTKGAAMMLLMKFYMMKGYYDKAETICRQLYAMEGRVYNLQSDYNYIFSYEGMGNDEVILQITCNDASRNTCNFVVADAMPTDFPWADKATGWGRGFIMPWEFYDTFESGDARLQNVYDHYTSTNGNLVTRSQLGTGAIPIKYGLQEDMIGDQCTIDMVVYRYSDVLLSLAELITRNQNKVTDEAINLVNRVRNRAKLPNLSIEATASKDAFMDALLMERLHEFYLEGLSRQDEIRFGKYIEWANERINDSNQNDGTAYYNVDDSHLKLFIPQSFVDESMNQIKQNPGY